MLELRVLKALLAIDKSASLKVAAERLSISPPTLTRLLQEAEESVGFQIFERARNGAFATSKGRLLLLEVAALLEASESFAASITDIRQEQSGLVKIGCGPLATLPIVLPLIGEEGGDSGQLRFVIKVEADADPIANLIEGTFDLFIGDLTHATAVSELEVVKLAPRQIVVAAHPKHPIQSNQPRKLADLVPYQLAMPHFHRYWRKSFELSMRSARSGPHKPVNQLLSVECDDYALLIELARCHGFITGGSRENFADVFATGALAEVTMDPPIMWNLCCARRMTDKSAHVERLWQRLLNAAT